MNRCLADGGLVRFIETLGKRLGFKARGGKGKFFLERLQQHLFAEYKNHNGSLRTVRTKLAA